MEISVEMTEKSGETTTFGFLIHATPVIFGAVCGVAAFIYAAATRHWTEFLIYPLVIAAFFYLVFVTTAIRQAKGHIKKATKFFIICIPVSLVAGVLYYSLAATAYDAFMFSSTYRSFKLTSMVFTAFATFVVGSLLFAIRSRFRCVYGLSEAMIGVMVATSRAGMESGTAFQDPNFYLAILTAGVYLVVRGFDNVQQGLNAKPGDPIANWLMRRYKSSIAGRPYKTFYKRKSTTTEQKTPDPVEPRAPI